MIICTNCNHKNPEGSVQCENCYAPLPITSSKTSPCPHCGAFVQSNATFCGQCGYNLRLEESLSLEDSAENSEDFLESDDNQDLHLLDRETIPPQAENDSLKSPWDTQTGGEEEEDFRLTSIAAPETAAIASASSNVAAGISEELAINAEEIEEIDNSEDLVAAEEFSLESNLENDDLNIDLVPDSELDLALEAELPDMSDIEELEATTAGLSSEIPDIPEPSPLDEDETYELEMSSEISESSVFDTEEVEEIEKAEDLVGAAEFSLETDVENDELDADLDSDLDLALESELPEMSDIDELEETTPGLGADVSDIPDLAEPSAIEELEVTIPDVDIDIASDAESAAPIASEIPAVEEPLSSSQPISPVSESATQLQLQRIILSHVQTDTDIEINQNLDIIRIGKPNSQIPPDIDVSGFPDSNIVSRVHANIRVEGDAYFLEDLGSSNGTYINHKPLPIGNRHRLRFGDRISLGKGDLMTFIFKIID